MRKYIIAFFLLFAAMKGLQAQPYEQVYFNDATWEIGIVLEIIPGDSLVLKKDNGEIKTYPMKIVRRIVKHFPELLESDKPNQTIKEAVSITGGIYINKYKGPLYTVVLNPSFDYFMKTNFSSGFIFYFEDLNGFSFNDAYCKEGIALRYFFGDKPDKVFVGVEGLVIGKSSIVFETGITLGYNYAVARNLALQPVFKLSLLKQKEEPLGYAKVSIGVKIANFIF